MLRALAPPIAFAAVLLCASLRAQAPDLPPADAFLREARDVFTKSQEVWYRYSYRERSTELHMNPFGRMGTGAIRVFEVRPAANPKLTYRRLIERDGVAVPESELRRQDAEYQSRAARIAQSGPDGAGRQHEDELLARKRAQMMVEDVVNTMQFDLTRREIRNGAAVIIV